MAPTGFDTSNNNIIIFLETTLTSTLDSSAEVETLPTSTPAAPATLAGSSSNSPATGVVTAESEEGEKEDNALNHSEAKAEETAAAATAVVVSDKTEQREEKQDEEDKETGAPALTTGTASLIFSFESESWMAAAL